MSKINISINLEKLLNSKAFIAKDGKRYICIDTVKQSEKNNEYYINLDVTKKKEIGKFGDTHAVSLPKKDFKNKDEAIIYVGSGKEFIFNSIQQQAPNTPIQPNQLNNNNEGVPF